MWIKGSFNASNPHMLVCYSLQYLHIAIRTAFLWG